MNYSLEGQLAYYELKKKSHNIQSIVSRHIHD